MLLPAADAADVIDDVVGSLMPRHDRSRAPATGRLKVARLDFARDFRCVPGDELELLNRVAAMPSRGHYKLTTVKKHGRIETVVIGPKRSWREVLYDKAREAGDRISGHLRCETQMRRRRLVSPWTVRAAGRPIATVGDVTEESAEALARETFELLGLGTAFRGGPSLADAIDAIPSMKGNTRTALLGFIQAKEAGLTWVSENTRAKYERLATEHGLWGLTTAPSDAVSLNWDAGTISRRAEGDHHHSGHRGGEVL